MATKVRKSGAWVSGSASPVPLYPSLNPADQMHGVYRGPWNTGVPYGTTLLPPTFPANFSNGNLDGLQAQGITVTTDTNGHYTQILVDRVNWVGGITISISGLTQPPTALSPWIKITNSLITTCSDSASVELINDTFNNAGDLVVQNCTFINSWGGSPAFDGSISILNCDAYGGGDCIHFHANTIVLDSYIHEPVAGIGAHVDLMQTLSGTQPLGVDIERNRLQLFTVHRYLGIAIPRNRIIQGNFPGYMTLKNNFIDGGTYCFDASQGGTTVIANNRFGRNFSYTVFQSQYSANQFGPSDVFHDTNTTVTTSH